MKATILLAVISLACPAGILAAQDSNNAVQPSPAVAKPDQPSRSATSSPGSNATTMQTKTSVPLANQIGQPDDWDSYWKGDYATGDWGGLRTELKNDGFEPFAYYNAIVAGNPVGGISHAAAYADDFYFGFKFDLDKMAGVHGLTLQIDAINRDGRDISKQIGSQYQVMELVGGETIHLYNVFLEQKLFDDVLSIKVGHMTAGDDFLTAPVYYYALNSGIDGNIRGSVFDTGFSTYPFAIWGARVRVDPSPEFNLQSGIYQKSDDEYDVNVHGLDFRIHSNDGYMIANQAGWTPEFAKEPVEVKAPDGKITTVQKGLAGHYFVGGYYSRFHYPQFGSTSVTAATYGFYASADQTVYQESPGSDQGLTLFAIASYSPQQNVAIIPLHLAGGLLYRGLFPNRDEDMVELGLIRGRFGDDYANSVVAANGGNPHAENIVELGYRFQFNAWSFFQPTVQYVMTPGGTGSIPDAVVLGTFFGVQF